MIEIGHKNIPVKRQAELLSVNRTSAYRIPAERVPDFRTVMLMHRIDAIYTAYPFYGYRRMTAALRQEGLLLSPV
jgi:putative transposase